MASDEVSAPSPKVEAATEGLPFLVAGVSSNMFPAEKAAAEEAELEVLCLDLRRVWGGGGAKEGRLLKVERVKLLKRVKSG